MQQLRQIVERLLSFGEGLLGCMLMLSFVAIFIPLDFLWRLYEQRAKIFGAEPIPTKDHLNGDHP